MRGAAARRWVLGLGLALVLLLAHVGPWRMVRNTLVQHVAFPVVTSVETPRAEGIALARSPRSITATETATGREAVYRAPASLEYLVAALVLIAAFPRRWYWLWLWLAHLALGIVGFGAFVLGVGWTGVGFGVGVLVRDYLAQALNLLALVAAFAPRLARRVS